MGRGNTLKPTETCSSVTGENVARVAKATKTSVDRDALAIGANAVPIKRTGVEFLCFFKKKKHFSTKRYALLWCIAVNLGHLFPIPKAKIIKLKRKKRKQCTNFGVL